MSLFKEFAALDGSYVHTKNQPKDLKILLYYYNPILFGYSLFDQQDRGMLFVVVHALHIHHRKVENNVEAVALLLLQQRRSRKLFLTFPLVLRKTPPGLIS